MMETLGRFVAKETQRSVSQLMYAIALVHVCLMYKYTQEIYHETELKRKNNILCVSSVSTQHIAKLEIKFMYTDVWN